jgi:RNA recognition motif-containing protein
VIFNDPAAVDRVMSDKNKNQFPDRLVDVKRFHPNAPPRDNAKPDPLPPSRPPPDYRPPPRGGNGEAASEHRIFVGGLPHDVDRQELRRVFAGFGVVLDATIMMDPQTQRSRGFGFVTYDRLTGQSAIEKILRIPAVQVRGRNVEVRRAAESESHNHSSVREPPPYRGEPELPRRGEPPPYARGDPDPPRRGGEPQYYREDPDPPRRGESYHRGEPEPSRRGDPPPYRGGEPPPYSRGGETEPPRRGEPERYPPPEMRRDSYPPSPRDRDRGPPRGDYGAPPPPPSNSDSNATNELFVGSLPFDVDRAELKRIFDLFGNVVDAIVVVDPATQRSRGFGFVTFDPSDGANAIQRVLRAVPLQVRGRTMEVKRAKPPMDVAPSRPQRSGRPDSPVQDGLYPHKIFVGGLPPDVDRAELKRHFQRYGDVLDTAVMIDPATHRSRCFGFVTFDREYGAASVERVLRSLPVLIQGKTIEIRRARPPSDNESPSGPPPPHRDEERRGGGPPPPRDEERRGGGPPPPRDEGRRGGGPPPPRDEVRRGGPPPPRDAERRGGEHPPTRDAERPRSLPSETSYNDSRNARREDSVGARDGAPPQHHTYKLFVGGLAPDIDRDELKRVFQAFGEVLDTVVMMDPATQRSRGFGYVTFDDIDGPKATDRILNMHAMQVHGRTVEVKLAMPSGAARKDPPPPPPEPEARIRTELPPEQSQYRVFVGGLPPEVDKTELKQIFSRFGAVVDTVVMMDATTHRSRGFGFVTFEESDGPGAIDRAMQAQPLSVHGRNVEIRRGRPPTAPGEGRKRANDESRGENRDDGRPPSPQQYSRRGEGEEDRHKRGRY